MKKLGKIWNKAIEPLGRSESERTMKLFYGPKFKPYSVTDEQGEKFTAGEIETFQILSKDWNGSYGDLLEASRSL